MVARAEARDAREEATNLSPNKLRVRSSLSIAVASAFPPSLSLSSAAAASSEHVPTTYEAGERNIYGNLL